MKPRKISAHKTLWSVVVFQGNSRGLVVLCRTKQEADAAAAKVKGAFVLPPLSAWAGKQEAHA